MNDLMCKGFSSDENGKEKIFINGEVVKGRWLEGYYIHLHKSAYCFSNEVDKKENNIDQIVFEQMTDWGLPNQYYKGDIIPNSLCRCTGFRDKNNKYIFEHDIIKIPDLGIKGKVCFEYGTFGIGTDKIINYKKLEKQIPKITGCDNELGCCTCDNFISFWGLLWNFNLYDIDGVIDMFEIIGNKFEQNLKDYKKINKKKKKVK